MESDLKGMRAIVAEHGSKMTPHLVDFVRRDWTAEELTGAIMVRKAVTNKMWRFMRNYDLLLTPTLAVPPFALHIQGVEKIDGRMVTPSQWLAFTFPFNMTGQPAASVPAGFTKLGLTGRVADRRPSPRRRFGAASRRVVRGGKTLGGCVARNGAMTTTDPFRVAVEPYYRPVGDEVTVFEAAYRHRLPVMLKGPTGCGKTRFLEYMAWRLHRPLITVAAHEDMTAADLVGRFLLVPGETVWHDGPLTLAVRGGAICYIDEIVEARQDTTVVIHPLTDARRILPLEKKNELVAAHADFQLVISYNPGYQSAVKDLKELTKQRFVGIDFGYPAAPVEAEIVARESGVDATLAATFVELGQRSRNLRGQGLEEGASTRMLIHAGRLVLAGLGPDAAARAALVLPLTDDRGVARGAGRRHRRLPGMTLAEATAGSQLSSSRLLVALRRRPALAGTVAAGMGRADATRRCGGRGALGREHVWRCCNANAGVACLAALLRLRGRPATLAEVAGMSPTSAAMPARQPRSPASRPGTGCARPDFGGLLPAGARGPDCVGLPPPTPPPSCKRSAQTGGPISSRSA